MSTVNDVCLFVCLFYVILENFSIHIVHIRRPTILVLVAERLTVELSLPTYVCLGLDSNIQHPAFEVNIFIHFSIAAVNIERNKKKICVYIEVYLFWTYIIRRATLCDILKNPLYCIHKEICSDFDNNLLQ